VSFGRPWREVVVDFAYEIDWLEEDGEQKQREQVEYKAQEQAGRMNLQRHMTSNIPSIVKISPS
jgi:hypothetical protein